MYKCSQTFYLDSSMVKGATEVGISKIDLYFRGKPKYRDNRSGIVGPGVEIFLATCINSIPIIGEVGTIRPAEPTEHGARFARLAIARCEWAEIAAATDGSAATTFRFSTPQFLKTDKEYAIIVKFDAGEDFILWTSTVGEKNVANGTVAAGPSGSTVGKYYTYIGPPNIDLDPVLVATIDDINSSVPRTTSNMPQPVNAALTQYLINNWRDNAATDLKFQIYFAKYALGGDSVSTTELDISTFAGNFARNYRPVKISNNVIRITAPNIPNEFILHDKALSTFSNGVMFGALMYQPQPYFPGGKVAPLTISVANNSTYANASGAYQINATSTFLQANGFNSLYTQGAEREHIVIVSGNNVCVREVLSIGANVCTLILNRPVSFTNTAAYFFKSPVGQLISAGRSYAFGALDEMLILHQSTANSSCRFVNNQILDLSPNVGGSGYANTDYLVINGFENVAVYCQGGYPAIANLSTNSTGGVTSIRMSNCGAGFQNASFIAGANIQVLNSSAMPSVGTGLTLTANIGALLSSEFAPISQYYAGIKVVNLDAARIKPEITVNQPAGTSYTINIQTNYNSVDTPLTTTGKGMVIDPTPDTFSIPVKIFKSHQFDINAKPVIPSRSNEFTARYANGAAGNSSVYGEIFSNSVIFTFDVSSNNDFITPFIEPDVIHSHYSKYVINNDYTNENTNYGNAYAKHISSKVNFAADKFAEDLIVYVTAYRPANTDIKVLARIHNSKDPEAFDDKDWTLLDCTDGGNVYSSTTDSADYIELTYSFGSSPNTSVISTSGSLSNTTSTVLAGSNLTSFAAGDLVKISPVLFPDSHFITVVNSVTNATSLVLNEPTNDNNVVGDGLQIEKILYPKQAFNYRPNDNVVRYYTLSKTPIDNFNTFQLKVIMLSTDNYQVPKIDDIRSVGVSA